jgi:hypothetical protein
MIQNFRRAAIASVNRGEVPNAVNLHLEPSEIVLNSAQPNVLAAAPYAALLTFKMWAMVLLTGIPVSDSRTGSVSLKAPDYRSPCHFQSYSA